MKPAHGGRLKHAVLRAVARARLDDAWVLLKAAQETKSPQRRVGSIYLAGYAVECALKARICYETVADILRKEYFTHDLQWLLSRTTMSIRIRRQEGIWQSFVLIRSVWEPALRYQLPSVGAEGARRFFESTKEVTTWLFSE